MSKIIKCSLKKISRRDGVGMIVLFLLVLAIKFLAPSNTLWRVIYYLFDFLLIIGYFLWIAYRNRYYPEFFKFEDDRMIISYANKGSFRLKKFNGIAAQCTMQQVGDDWHILQDDQLLAVIKPDMLNEEEIEFIKTQLCA